MGWVWKDDAPLTSSSAASNSDRCSTRKIISTQCRTEETEPGKFIKKCQNTEQIFRDCVGKPSELLQSNKEYSEEDVTDQMMKGSIPSESSDQRPFNFPGLRSDIDAIERSLFSGFNRFFEAAEDMRNEFFNVFGSPYNNDDSSSSYNRHGIPMEDLPAEVPKQKSFNSDASPKVYHSDGDVDISGLARDV
ncbi:hypothetical protein LIER_16475 [Lithospermum erythrorhizon]|uniref:Mal d 1-associated protein n=1 Tax=Lithospermum erythrorhizon TaxID=34254 RepID=A0AAV3QAW9_LITER